jgi:hypothetical protein
MEPASEVPIADADGVLVISAWSEGASGKLLARVTMAASADPEPAVRVVTSPDDLHDVVDEWLGRILR